MRIIVTILLVISSIFAQEVKIDSVAIQAKMVELDANIELIVTTANDQIGQLKFAKTVLEGMLVPEEVIVEDE